ncbi:MAG: hypothetical protein V3T31_06105 [candidate division Zixibacteria bacterium]
MKKRLMLTLLALFALAMTATAQHGMHNSKKNVEHNKEIFIIDGKGGMDCDMHFGQKGGLGCDMTFGGKGNMHKGHGQVIGRLLRHAKELDLSDSQMDQLKEMRLEFQTEQIDRQAELKKANLRLNSHMHDDEAAEKTVLAAIDEVAAMQANMKKLKYQHRKAVHGLLSDDQLEQFKQMNARGNQMIWFDDGDADDNDDDDNVMMFKRKFKKSGH